MLIGQLLETDFLYLVLKLDFHNLFWALLEMLLLILWSLHVYAQGQGSGCDCLASNNSAHGAVKANGSTSPCLLGLQGFPLFSESFILLASDMDEVCSSTAPAFAVSSH